MDLAQARARLERMLQWNAAPALTTAEVDDLMLFARRPDASGYIASDVWVASTAYPLSTIRVPTVGNGYAYYVTTPGTSGVTQPTWPTVSGSTVTDGTVVWSLAGSYQWTPTWNLRAAAAEGWRWKAAKVVAQYDVAAGGGTSFNRSQQYKHCIEMARTFGSGVGAIQMVSGYAGRSGS